MKIRALGAVFAACVCLASVSVSAQELGWQWNETENTWYYYKQENTGATDTSAQETGALTAEQAVGAETLAAASDANSGANAGVLQTEETAQSYTGWVADGADWYYVENSKMMTGWIYTGGSFYFLNTDGRMAANTWVGNFYCGESGAVLTDTVTPDGVQVDENGARMEKGVSTEPATPYLSIIKQHPTFFAVFGEGNNGGFRVSIENGKYCYKQMDIYAENLDEVGSAKQLYGGDGFFNLNMVVRLKDGDWRIKGNKKTLAFRDFTIETPRFRAKRCQFNPAGYLTYVELS